MIRKILCVSLIAFSLYACGGNDTSNNDKTATTGAENNNTAGGTGAEGNTGAAGSTTATATPAGGISAEDADKGLALIGQSDCLGCHKVEEKLVGPPYMEVAKKYPTNDSTINYLASKIIQGGAGVWGQIPMAPHPQISKEDAALMAKYVLSLKQ